MVAQPCEYTEHWTEYTEHWTVYFKWTDYLEYELHRNPSFFQVKLLINCGAKEKAVSI